MRELEEQLELARYAEYDKDSDSSDAGSDSDERSNEKKKSGGKQSSAEQSISGGEAARKIDQLEAEVRQRNDCCNLLLLT